MEGPDLLSTGARPSPAGGAASSLQGRGPPPLGLGLLPEFDADGEGGERWMQVAVDGKGVRYMNTCGCGREAGGLGLGICIPL